MILLKYKTFTPNRAWMYDRLHPSQGGIKPKFYEGVEEFIMACVRTEQFTYEGTSRCPYCKCKCKRFLGIKSIRYHLYKDGFKPDYWVWTEHGETPTIGESIWCELCWKYFNWVSM